MALGFPVQIIHLLFVCFKAYQAGCGAAFIKVFRVFDRPRLRMRADPLELRAVELWPASIDADSVFQESYVGFVRLAIRQSPHEL